MESIIEWDSVVNFGKKVVDESGNVDKQWKIASGIYFTDGYCAKRTKNHK